jgi:hypothetical protein
MYGFSSRIMSYVFNMLICVNMILVDNLLQCLLFIAMIDLCRTCDNTATLIYNVLVMFMIYSFFEKYSTNVDTHTHMSTYPYEHTHTLPL